MATRKAKITKVKSRKAPKIKTYKPKAVKIKTATKYKAQKSPKVGQKTYKNTAANRGITKATKNTGSRTPVTPKPQRLLLNNY